MIVDALELPNGSIVQTDVCVVGAGPAGITIARELTGSRLRVCVVEAGGSDNERSIQSQARVVSVGDLDLSDTRRWQFGGAANLWAVESADFDHHVRHVELRKIDFERRDWVEHSGWPLRKDDLDPFYARAHVACGLRDPSFRPSDWESPMVRRFAVDENRLVTAMEHIGRADVFTGRARDELRRAGNVTVLLHAQVLELIESENGRSVQRARFACPHGAQHQIEARIWVLAAGAVENARLLLLSSSRRASGIANQNDVVGRFFMDHIYVRSAMLRPCGSDPYRRAALYDLRHVRGSRVMAKLSTADAEMRSQRLLNTAVRLSPKPRAETIEAMRAIRRAIRSGPGGFRESVALLVDQVLPSAHYVLTSVLPLAVRQRRLRPFIRYGWSEIPPELAKFVGFELELQIELAPRPENRVTLATDRDSWGRAAAEVRWRWSDLDLSSLRETERMIASELENSGLGRVQPCEPDRWPNIVSASGAHHHMGTTRMHMDPKQGVVDADCRAHGVENLYLAGSSVFPTGGYANPTLTIIALSIRLADRIAKLARDTPAPVALPTDSSAPRGPIAST